MLPVIVRCGLLASEVPTFFSYELPSISKVEALAGLSC